MRASVSVLATDFDLKNSAEFVQDLHQIFGYAIQADLVGTPLGVAKLQASVDGNTYVDIQDGSFSITTEGSSLWNVADSNYQYVKFVWTPDGGGGSDGTGTVKLYQRGF